MKLIPKMRKQAISSVDKANAESVRTEGTEVSASTRSGSSAFFEATEPNSFETNVQQEMSRFKRSTESALKRKSLLSSDEFTLNKLNTSELGLYGREQEVQRLESTLTSLLESKKRNPAMITVKGYSGTGKSALVQHLKGFIHQNGGIFTSGKYEMQSKSEPYAAFRTAFSFVIDHLIKKLTEDELKVIRDKTKELLGQDWKVLLDVFPNLNLLLGETLNEEDEGTKNDASENIEGRHGAVRLKFYFQAFFRYLCKSTNPIVVLLDDIQWADLPSIELMEAFLFDSDAPPALLIATYRDNEVDSDHAFSKLLVQLREKQIPVEEIFLHGLGVEAVNKIVSTTLRMEESETNSLSELVCSKTRGNPFFLIQFLQSLVDEDKLTYNFGTLKWYWSLGEIQDMMVTNNVAGLLAARITKLSQEMQLVLQIASCLGRSFETADLVDIVGFLVASGELYSDFDASRSVKSLVNALVKVGMFELVGTKLYFAHDQIQTAAGVSIPEAVRPAIQYRTAKYFLTRGPGWYVNDHELFLAAGLSESGIDLVTDQDERQSFAGVNLRASQHAMRKSAFDAASRYAEVGMKFLGPKMWETSYELAVRLGSIAVEAANCSGDFDRMKSYAADVIRHGRCIEDKISVYRTRLVFYTAQERFEEGIDYGLFVLKELGFRPPPRNSSTIIVLRDLVRTIYVMRNHTLKSLISLPRMTDRKMIWACAVIDKMSIMTFFTNKNLLVILTLLSVVWTSKFGVNEYSPIAITIWGTLNHTVLGNVDKGVMYAEAALQLAQKLECKSTMTSIVQLVYGHLYHWKTDMRASIQPSWYGYVSGMEVGNVEVAMYNLGQYDGVKFFTGASLRSLLVDLQAHVSIMKEFNQDAIRNYCLCILQLAYKLAGKESDTSKLSGSVMNEEELLKTARDTGNEHLELWIVSFIMDCAFLFGNFKLAGRNAEITDRLGSKVGGGHYSVPRHTFIRALTAVALYHEEIERRKNLSKVKKIAKKMKKWQSEGNVNIIHMRSLLDAELAAIKGERGTAAELYKDSIRIAARNGFTNDAALAHERAAVFYLSCQDSYWASHHITEAIRCYEDWSADAKVELLRIAYQDVLESQ